MSPKILRLEVGQALSADLQVIAVKAAEMVVKIKLAVVMMQIVTT